MWSWSKSGSPANVRNPVTVASVTPRSSYCTTSTEYTLTLQCPHSSSKYITKCGMSSVLIRRFMSTSSWLMPILWVQAAFRLLSVSLSLPNQSVTPDSLNRLVACTADDSQIIAICGETKLDNEEGSWWTMIQVYKYYISHHLSKDFKSLFGSVTCLPGCFSLYHIRTADKGWPTIISNPIIKEYAEPNVDTRTCSPLVKIDSWQH